MTPKPSPAPTDGRWVFRCPTCGRADEQTQADLVRYEQAGWPQCCGRVMNYHLAADAARCPTCGRVGGLTFPAAAAGPVRIVCTACALPPADGTGS